MALSKILLLFAAWIAVLITLAVVFIFLMQPHIREYGILYALGAVVVGYMSSAWTFVYSQINLSQIVRRIKENTLLQIQNEINKLYQSLSKLEKPDFERLNSLMELHSTISKRPNSLVDLSTLRTFLGSLLTPTLVTIIGLVDKDHPLHEAARGPAARCGEEGQRGERGKIDRADVARVEGRRPPRPQRFAERGREKQHERGGGHDNTFDDDDEAKEDRNAGGVGADVEHDVMPFVK